MAKLPRTGVSYQCLDERSLSEVMASLGFKPLSKKAERKLRQDLGLAIGKWEELCPRNKVDDIVRLLKSHASKLDKVAQMAAVAKGGMCRIEEIETAARVAHALGETAPVGSLEAAYAYLEDFGDRAVAIASACRTAATNLQLTKGNDGRSPYEWHDEFTAILLGICKQNAIKPTICVDRISGEAAGRLFLVAAAFECLLPPNRRSRTPQALVKRLQRSLKRLDARS